MSSMITPAEFRRALSLYTDGKKDRNIIIMDTMYSRAHRLDAFMGGLVKLWSGRVHKDVMFGKYWAHEFQLYNRPMFIVISKSLNMFNFDLRSWDVSVGRNYSKSCCMWRLPIDLISSEFKTELAFLCDREFPVEDVLSDDEVYGLLCDMGLKLV